ncbi:hypothetical protein CTEN210_13131 [Chaetoceros tenuissimus]|uniref:Peptidase S54 rhomboid domain-containing protein n=1 Tax=Chaetoceros tenuissimus TaxID=426638 RepID=A0AAD3D4N8_9STRA|nr:hypothetical protein CTEN210_13131 [Chaetoceros tenuissimus]
MYPYAVIYRHQIYRMITSAFFHGGLMHIGMNMLSYAALGKTLENHLGTLFLAFTVVNSVVYSSFLYLFISVIASMIGYSTWMTTQSLGFSGVLFHLLVLESYRNPNASHSIFGIITVSSKIYPWAMLLVIQFLLPNISFLGHFSGILTGLLQLNGYLKYTIPSPESLRMYDDLEGLTFITNCPNFVDTPSNDQYVMFMRTSGENASVGQMFRGAIIVIQNLWDTIMFIVLGRRRQDDERPVHESYSILNEDEWNGIPSQSEIQQSEMV